MADRKHRSGVWHHRVPDFKLVYCGPRASFAEVTKVIIKERSVKVSVNADKDDTADKKLETQKTIGQ